MPISVPGVSSRRGFRPARERGLTPPHACGFTLLELLVVVLIMGLCVGLVSAIARPDDGVVLRVEAERLAQLLDLAAVESRLTGKPIAWTAALTAQGSQYRFWRLRDDGSWSEADESSLRPRSLPPGMAISDLRIEALPSQAGVRLEFNPYGARAFDFQVSLGAAHYSVAGSALGEVRTDASR